MAAQLNKRLQQQLNTTYQQMRMIVACGELAFLPSTEIFRNFQLVASLVNFSHFSLIRELTLRAHIIVTGRTFHLQRRFLGEGGEASADDDALAVRIVPRVVPERVLPPAARGEQKAPPTGRPAKRMRCCESERRQVLVRIIVGGGRNDSRRGSG